MHLALALSLGVLSPIQLAASVSSGAAVAVCFAPEEDCAAFAVRPIDKAGLHKATGAVAADMESHLVARLALRARRPFAVLRVIGDPAERALPPAALIGMRPDGHVNLAAVLASLLRNPRQLPDLMRVASDVRIAMSALTRCRRALGPQLGWVTADRTAGSAVQ